MARDEAGREHDSDRSALQHGEKESKLLDRREYVKLAGASVAALGGVGLGSSSVSAAAESGPSNTDEWNLAFEDKFESGSLDKSKWEVGFGWGMDTTASAESISAEHVNVKDNALHLTASHSGGNVTAGSVHTRGKHYWGPGSYWEAKIKLPQRVGFLPAFWSKSNDGSWPPEIDFMELFQDGDAKDVKYANYNVHYSESTQPGDSGSHATEPVHHKTDYNLCESAHVFGCKWLKDRVEYFFDGQKVGESNGATAMEALRNGAPFYMMLNIHIDKVGTTDKSEQWSEEMVVDWVRVWEHAPNSSSNDGGSSQDGQQTDGSSSGNGSSSDGGDSSGNRDSPSADDLPNKLVVDGSETPNAASTYTFTVSGEARKSSELGTINAYDSIEDGEISGRVIGGKDGYRFSGEITSFSLDGPANVRVEDGS